MYPYKDREYVNNWKYFIRFSRKKYDNIMIKIAYYNATKCVVVLTFILFLI